MIRALLILLAACAQHPMIGVRGDEVLHHLDELGQTGSTHVATVRVADHAQTPADSETIFLSQTVTFESSRALLQNVVEGCGPFSGLRPCRIRNTSLIMLHDLDAAAADRAHYGEMPTPRTPPSEESPLTVEKAISATFFFGGLAGVGLCVALCEDHKLGYSVALGSGALIAGVLWAVLSGDVRD